METKLIHVKGGSFIKGLTDNLNPFETTISAAENKVSVMDFYLDTHPVSNALFIKFLNVRRTILTHKNLLLIHLGAEDCRIYRKGLRFMVQPGYEDFPVVYITWYGAETYARWAGKRLPTETEWEYVAQNATVAPTRSLAKVNEAESDAGGFCHLLGNVWEWCSDWYTFKDPARITLDNPEGILTTRQKVLKGGAWNSSVADLTAAARTFGDPRLSSNNIGFRCARS